ncbi:MAG: cupredoxin domain-containing protein [Chloroflexi bacterium]|nr:cupredoxin domain-containing protein [Chloroflexota bacterium]
MSQDGSANVGKVAATAVMLLGLALVLTACEYPGIPHPLAEELRVSQPGAAIRRAAAGEREPGSGTSRFLAATVDSAAVLQGRVEITLRDFSLNPNTVTVLAGPTTFVLKNEGRYTHDFRIQGGGADETAPKVGAGRTGEWTVTLAPGEYRISCPISNHDERGMEGKMVVAR